MIQGLDLPASLELYVQKEKFVIFLLLKLIIYDKDYFVHVAALLLVTEA